MENLEKYQFMAPDQANPYDSLGEIQAYSGHYDEAIENLNRRSKMKPDFFLAYATWGSPTRARATTRSDRGVPPRRPRRDDDDVRTRAPPRGPPRRPSWRRTTAQARQLIAEFRAVPGDKNAEITGMRDGRLQALAREPTRGDGAAPAEVAPKIVAA